jgi:hypothetical protein
MENEVWERPLLSKRMGLSRGSDLDVMVGGDDVS